MAGPAVLQVAVVIVTYSSARVLGKCLAALAAQTRRADLVVIVDNASPEPAYLPAAEPDAGRTVIHNPRNVGFCRANNIGYAAARHCNYVLFLNPDAFALPDLIERALDWMQNPENANVGIVTGTLLGYDIAFGQPTGIIDSTGIFQRSYGKWYDRGQGTSWSGSAPTISSEEVPAVCGALMFCRSSALGQSALGACQVFDERFFMYKEDIDLSLRMRRHGWRLVYIASLLCFHCRGWQGRRRMSARARFLSARNEMCVCLRNHGKGFGYSALKLLIVPLESAVFALLRKMERLRTFRSDERME